MTTVILSSCLLLLILNKGFFEGLAEAAKSAEAKALRICSKNQRYEVMRSMVHCAPRDTVVPVFTPPNLSSIQPRHTIVKKCQGSCWALPHSCISTQTRNLSLSITGLTGFGVEVCTIVRVEEDMACQCKCETQPSECHPTQIYSPTSCQCLCENHLDKARCIQQGKNWNEENCRCTCPEYTRTACSTGYIFDDQETCMCQRIFNMTFTEDCNNFVVIIVGIFSIILVTLCVFILYLKRMYQKHEKCVFCSQTQASIVRELSRMSK